MKNVELISDRFRTPDLELENRISAFESAFLRDPTVDLNDFVPDDGHPQKIEILVELIRVEMEFRWDRGDEVRASSYFARFPVLQKNSAIADVILGEESRLHRVKCNQSNPDVGDKPDTIRQSIQLAREPLDCSREIVVENRSVDRSGYPAVGGQICEFRIIGELGRGAFGRVYLATQSGLADRLVALKVSSKFPRESHTLARLQHANIVPVYSIHRHGEFHVICMPFLGSITLADLVQELHQDGRVPASGVQVAVTLSKRHAKTIRDLADTLVVDEPPTDTGIPLTFPPSIRELYGRSNFVELALWIGSELADGLAHAHERGILHRDIKPANILISDEGRPMLLDFNLAVAGESDQDTIGGTLRYMSPESLDRVLGAKTPLDSRSDIFSLGLVLQELLTGKIPYLDPGDSRDRSIAAMRDDRLHPVRLETSASGAITPAIVSIISKCLAPDPADRYLSASDLREDLRSQLAHQRLKHAPDRSLWERSRKWSKRHPRLSSWISVTIVSVIVLFSLSASYWTLQTRYSRVEAKNQLAVLETEERRVSSMLTDRNSPTAELMETISIAKSAISKYPDIDHENWTIHPFVGPLDAAGRVELNRSLSELQYRLAGAELILAQRDSTNAEKRLISAQSAVDAATKLSANSDRRSLLADQAKLIEMLRSGKHSPDDITDFSSSDREQLTKFYREGSGDAGSGRFWLAAGKLHLNLRETNQAKACLRIATELQPNDVWVWYHSGNMSLIAQDFGDAINAFSKCIALRQDVPEAYLNRAIAKIRIGEYQSAIDDLNLIEKHATAIPRLFFIRENAKRKLGDNAGANRDRMAGLKLKPLDGAGWIARGEAKLDSQPSDPQGAVDDFRQAIQVDPSMPQGYQNLANVLSEVLNKPAEAVEVLNNAVTRFPWYTPARSGRSVLLARLGKSRDAREDAEQAIRLDPSAINYYQAGCVFLLTASNLEDRRRGMRHLRKALRLDPSWATQMREDPDLKAIKDSPEFLKLTESASHILEADSAG